MLACQDRSHAVQLVGRKLLFLALLLVHGITASQAVGKNETQTELEDRIAGLIQDLGSEKFFRRDRAQEALSELGVKAFDALFFAQHHGDVEIRLQARALLKAIDIEWYQDSSSFSVKRLMKSYDSLGVWQRNSIINALKKIKDRAGIPTLLQIVRFDTSDFLSKRAALAVLELQTEDDDSGKTTFIEQPLDLAALGLSRRVGAKWLQTFQEFRDDPNATLPRWDDYSRVEQEKVRTSKSRLQRALAEDLMKLHVAILETADAQEDIHPKIHRALLATMLEPSDLIGMLEWLIKREAWQTIDAAEKDFANFLQQQPLLIYLVAKSCRQRNLTERTENLLAQARNITSQQNAYQRIDLGQQLSSHVMIDWAIAELQRLVDELEFGGSDDAYARIALADIHFDWGNFKNTYEVLKPMEEKLKSDPSYQRMIDRFSRRRTQLHKHYRSLCLFALGMHQTDQKQIQEAKDNFKKAWSLDKTNIDIMIAMNRIDTDNKEWMSYTKSEIDRIVNQFDREVQLAERNYLQQPNSTNSEELAKACNQYAWMVSNTYGDFALALKRSKTSVEKVGEYAGYLDTLARCHFALKQYDDAIKVQKKAAKLEPQTGQIARQLDEFLEFAENDQN